MRRTAGPALNAMASILLVFSLAAALIGFLAYRWLTRGERSEGATEALTSITGM